MQGPAGKWYEQLTPTEVLGLYADSPQDQQHFAELAAKEQHDKIAREIAFNNAFTVAMQKLYAHEPVIKDFDMSAFNPMKKSVTDQSKVKLKPGDRLQLWIDTNKVIDFTVVPELLALINTHPNIGLDIYAVNPCADAAIQLWAQSNHVPLDQVAKGVITLNHAKASPNHLLPFVSLKRAGQMQVVELPKLL